MNIFEQLSKANLKVGTHRLKWFVDKDVIVFYDSFNPIREAHIPRTDNLETMITEAEETLFNRNWK